MARRETPEINAGSMADIAFLLLVFFLMVTKIEGETGIFRVLPPLPEEQKPQEVHEEDVFIVLVNMNDELLVENEYMDIGALKAAAKVFMVADGVFGSTGSSTKYPNRELVQKSAVNTAWQEAKANLRVVEAKDGVTNIEIKTAKSRVSKFRKKVKAIEFFGKEYRELPGSAIISMQNNNNTSYNRYLQVQNELQAAIGELRDELAEEFFGMTYSMLNEEYEKNRNDDAIAIPIQDKMYAVQAVFPSRISEAEPKNVQAY